MPYVNPHNPPVAPDAAPRQYRDGQPLRKPDTGPTTPYDPTRDLWAPKEKTPARGRGEGSTSK